MTTQQPEALRLAELLELAPEDGIEPQTAEDAAAGLRRLHSENESLQAGYAAARLEIESLQARIKTMAEEHADELMVAHLDGRMCAAQPAGVQQPGSAYADLMQEASDWICEHVQNDTTGAMMWAIRLQSAAQNLRASHGQAPAQPSPAAQGNALDAACQRACMELPKGMGMAIQLERDAGWIELHDSYNDQIKLPNADGSLAEQVHQAIDAARAAQGGKT